MGDFTFVEGIGDEVVLFVGFLAISVAFLIFVGLWQSRGQAGAEQSDREPRRPEEADVASVVGTTEGTNSEGLLRHRTTTSSTTTSPAVSTTEETGTRQEFVEEDRSDGPEEPQNVSFAIRLVIAGRTDHPKEVQVTSSCTVDQIRQAHFQDELAQNCPVKFIYQGRLISDDSTTIGNLGITDGGAMHVHVGRPRPHGEPPPPPPMQQLDLSRFFLPLLGLILGIVWMAMLSYPYIFNIITKVFLFVLSFGYVVLTYFSTFGTRT